MVTQQFSNQLPPCISRSAPQVYRKVYQSILAGWVQAAHDISEGGLTVAAAEMCIAGRLGLQLVLPGNDPILSLFGETNGCLLLEISAGQALLFEKNFAGLPYKKIGHITDAPALFIAHNGSVIITLSVDDLVKAWIR